MIIHFYNAKLRNCSAKLLPIIVNINYIHTLHTAKLQNIPLFPVKNPTIRILTLFNRPVKTFCYDERFSNT